MKLILPICLLAASQLLAAVPTAINYQGRLTDGDGNPASGSKTFSLKIHDAATGGNEIYSETIGSVVVDANGIYNFQFGANGSSVVATDTVIATTNGSSQVFNATLDPLPIDGSVTISDGTYTWSQADGASEPTQFTGSVTPATGAVSAIYLSGAPTSGTEITASYNFTESGLSGALSSGIAHWLELTINGETQTPRERVLSVPFAQVAQTLVNDAPKIIKRTATYMSGWRFYNSAGRVDLVSLPINGLSDLASNGAYLTPLTYFLEPDFSKIAITSLQAEMKEVLGTTATVSHAYGFVEIIARSYDSGTESVIAQVSTADNISYAVFNDDDRVLLDWSENSYYLRARFGASPAQYTSSAAIKWVKLTFEHAE